MQSAVFYEDKDHVLSSRPHEEEALIEADSGSVGQTLSTKTAKNRRKKERKNLKSQDKARCCNVALTQGTSAISRSKSGGLSNESATMHSISKERESKAASESSLIEWGREQENLELGKSLDGKACGEWKYWNCANFKNCPWTQRSSSGRPTVLSKCGKCLWTRYCSRDCQKKHWQQHKAHCTNPGFMRIAEQSTKVLRKEFDERRDLLIDLEKRLQTEKSYLQTAVERKDIEPTFSKADERSTIVEKELEKVYKKECKEWMRSLEDQILKQKAGMKEAMETIAGCAAGVARIPIMEEATPVLTIFLTIFSEVNIGREQTVGGLLFKKHNTKGAISMEFDSVAVVKKAIAWLDHKKEDFVERRDNKRVDKAALHSSSNVLPRLFLDQQINGMVVSYMTSLEAYLKAETIRSALSFLSTPAIGQFVAKDVELFEKLCYAIEDYDRRHAVLLHVYLKIHLSKIEEGKHFFIHRWVVAN